jgi:acetyltransferase
LAEVAAAYPAACPASSDGDGGPVFLSELDARRLVESHNVPVVQCVLARSAEDCGEAVGELTEAAAVKVLSAAVPHKTDAGGVALGVAGRAAGADAYRQVVASVAAYAERNGFDPSIQGVLVSPMLPEPLAELIVGVRCDPHYGPVVTVGAGGTSVEILGDVSIRGLPIDGEVVAEMLDELKISALINGFRGSQPADREALNGLILGVVGCALDNPDIREIELNPVMVYATHCVAVDVRAFVRDTVG